MSFEETLEQTIAMLRRNKRVSYRALRRQFNVDEEYVEDLKAELVEVLKLAADEDGKVLVWIGAEPDLAMAAKVAADLVDTLADASRKEASRVADETAAGRPPQTAPGLSPGQASGRTAEGERRHLTVMFCDLVDSTPLAERLDPEELADVYAVWQEACIEEIAKHGGHISDYRGDGIFVYFGYPTAYEDGPHRALRAGLGVLSRLHDVNARLQARHQTTLAVRIGIHTGLVLLSDLGGRFIRNQFAVGETPNIAARLQALAEPNQIIISGSVGSLVRGYFNVADLGEQSLKGVSRPIVVCRVIGQTVAVDRMQASEAKGRTPFVARESEIAALQLRWMLSTQGHGQAVLLIGEAGIGKSRVVEAVNTMAEAAGAQRIIFRCSPYHSASALHPFVDNIVRTLGIGPDDPGHESHAKLEHALANSAAPDAARDAELIATVLALPQREMPLTQTLTAHQRRTQALDAMVAWTVRSAAKRPVLFAIEDIHWADPSTLEFLGLVLDAIGDVRVNVVMTSRPEYQLPFPIRPNLTRITLGRLTDAQAERLVDNAFRGKSIPAELRHQIVARADGVPLFVEELVAMILESGMLREEDGNYVPIQSLATLPIPLTLQDSLAARLDRLAEARDTAQLAAALGREFSFELISSVSPLDISTLLNRLKMLVESELIQQQGEAPNATYRFKHALIQDAAYQSMLRTRRRQYHEMIATTLEQRFAGVLEMQPEIVAHHFTEAGLVAPATRYWRQAGEHALRRSANVEALHHLDRGIALLNSGETTPARSIEELPLQLARGAALMMVKGHFAPEVEACFARARALSQELDDTPDLFTVLFGLWRSQLARGALDSARDIAEQLMGIADRLDDPALRLGAHSALSLVLYHLCEFPRSRALAEVGVVLFETASLRMQGSPIMNMGQHPALACYLCLSFIHTLTGTPDQGLARQRQAMRLAQQTGIAFQIATATGWSVMLASLRRDDEAALDNADKVLALAEQHVFPQWDLVGRFYRGIHLMETGAHEDGLGLARAMIGVADKLGYGTIRMRFRTLMAQACGAAGQAEEGLAALREAMALANHSGERWWEAEMYRIEGELTLQAGADNAAAAETCFRRALERAHALGLRLFELRAATNLARLYETQHRPAEARRAIAPVLAVFTEGFGTRDLIDARAVLDRIPA